MPVNQPHDRPSPHMTDDQLEELRRWADQHGSAPRRNAILAALRELADLVEAGTARVKGYTWMREHVSLAGVTRVDQQTLQLEVEVRQPARKVIKDRGRKRALPRGR